MPRPPTITVATPDAPAWVARYPEAVHMWTNDLAWRCAAIEATQQGARNHLLIQAGVELPATPRQYDHLRKIARSGVSESYYRNEVRRMNADEAAAGDIWEQINDR